MKTKELQKAVDEGMSWRLPNSHNLVKAILYFDNDYGRPPNTENDFRVHIGSMLKRMDELGVK